MSGGTFDADLTPEQREERARRIDSAAERARAAYSAAVGCRCGRALALLSAAFSELELRANEVRGTVPE